MAIFNVYNATGDLVRAINAEYITSDGASVSFCNKAFSSRTGSSAEVTAVVHLDRGMCVQRAA